MPLADAISGFMSGTVKPILDKFVPDAKDRLEAELLITKNLQEINLAQIDLNKVEASSSSLFVSGWRPFIGWVCGASFAYAVIGNDLLNWSMQLVSLYSGKTIPPFPEPDVSITFEILMAMLGLGGLRTYEKFKGVTK